MKMNIGDVKIAIGFNRKDQAEADFKNAFYRPHQIDERDVKVEYFALRVVEELEYTKDPHSGEFVDHKGYVLEDQFGNRWNYNWPVYDDTGTGLNFERDVSHIKTDDYSTFSSEHVICARAAKNVLSSLIRESAYYKDPEKYKDLDDTIKLYRYKWLRNTHDTYIAEIEKRLYVNVERKHAFGDQKLDIEKFSDYDFVPIKFQGHEVLTALALFGDGKMHPDFLMRNRDKELALIVYRDIHQKSATDSFDLLTPDIFEGVQTLVANLRNMIQNLFNELTQKQYLIDEREQDLSEGARAVRLRREEEDRLRKAGPSFIKNNIVDYGDETVAQVAERLGISKGEVRRRKQAGTL